MEINKEILGKLFEQAVENPRLRQSYDLRTSSDDNSQRILNALLPGTVVSIHRHPNSNENVLLLCGKLVEVIYDENGEILQFSQSTADENNNTEKLYFESPNSESTSIRVVVEKPILGEKERWENKNGNGATYEEIGKETVFDKVIQIK